MTEMNDSDSLAIYMIIGCIAWIFVIAVLPTTINELNTELDNAYIKINHVGIVTDKWVKQDTAFFVFGTKDVFVLEINNDFTKDVSDQIYYSTNIGDYSNWTTKTIKS